MPRKLGKVNEDFFKDWSSDMAYILGFFYADGSLKMQEYKSTKGETRLRYYVRFSSKDLEVIEYIKNCLGSSHKIQISKIGVLTLEIGSKVMFDSLVELGLSVNKTNCEVDIKVNPNYESDFWRGFIDGDGSITYDKGNVRVSAYFTEYNSIMVERFKSYLELNDVKYWSRKFRHKRGTIDMYEVIVGRKLEVVKIKSLLYNNDKFSLTRKRVRMEVV